MELIEILIYFMICLFAIIGGWLVGRVMDPVWRCNKLRQFTKKPYIILNIIQKDGLLINTKVVNAEKDVIVTGTDMWIITKGSIHLKTKEGLIRESGFTIKQQNIRSEEGAPTVYVDMDSLKPIGFYARNEEDAVKPTEIGSTLLAWVFNQFAKKMAGIERQQLFIYIILGLCVLNLIVSFNAGQQAGDTLTIVKDMQAAGAGVLPIGTIVQNGSIQIVQPR